MFLKLTLTYHKSPLAQGLESKLSENQTERFQVNGIACKPHLTCWVHVSAHNNMQHSAGALTAPDQEPTDLDRLRYYYSVARALHRGQEGRPSLPPELVLYIFRSCSITRHDPSPTLLLRWLPESAPACSVTAAGGDISDRLWCATSPLSKRFLEQSHKLRLVTTSKDQGWCR